jgi:glycosyltransferase involved in cell wall biosynthesis
MSRSAAQGPAWLILPTYEEAGNIESFVASARENLPASARILIVDDNSPDGTGEIADRLTATDYERFTVEGRGDPVDLSKASIKTLPTPSIVKNG